MESLDNWQMETEVDISDLERKLNEVFHELSQKRTSLEDVRHQLTAESASKQDLQLNMDKLNREVNDLKIQLDATTNAFHTCEETLNAARAAAMPQKLQLDAAINMNESLREQAVSLQTEILSFKNKVEELERELRSNEMIKESCLAKQTKIHKLLDSLTVQVRNLEKDRRSFERLITVATELGNKNQQLIEHYSSILQYNEEQKENLYKQVIKLSAENDLLRKETKNSQQSNIQKPNEKGDYMEDVMQEWQTSLGEMKARATAEAKESEKLHLTLKNVLEAQVKLQNLEISACEKIKELEISLAEERELHKKPASEDTHQQTEMVDVMDVGCGSENKTFQHSHAQTEQAKHSHTEVQTETDLGEGTSPEPKVNLIYTPIVKGTTEKKTPEKKFSLSKLKKTPPTTLPSKPKIEQFQVETGSIFPGPSLEPEDVSEMLTQIRNTSESSL